MSAGSLYLMFLFYGLSFFILGFVSLFLRSGKYTSDPLLRNLLYLGLFGIFHGLAEWAVLFQHIADISRGYRLPPHSILVLNGTSFLFLAVFGLRLNRIKVTSVLTVWSVMLAIGILIEPISRDLILRWFIGSPASLLSGIGLFREGFRFRKSGKFRIGNPLIILALSFSLYAIAVGIVFPQSISAENPFQPEMIRLTLTLVSSIAIVIIGFRIRNSEQELLWALKKDEVIYRERMRLGRDLHDRVLQKLFAAGLTMDRCLETDKKDIEEVLMARKLVSESSKSIRQFLHSIQEHPIKVKDFLSLAEDQCARMAQSMAVEIALDMKGFYPILQDSDNYWLENSDDLLAILEEAVTNSVRHSGIRALKVHLVYDIKFNMEIIDGGTGFDQELIQKGNGLVFMRNRARNIGADLTVKSDDKGTEVRLSHSVNYKVQREES